MARHRFGARGNALSFPLPWEDVLQALQAGGGRAAALPRSGAELGQLVRVLLKTNKKGKTTDAEIKGLIHQANVRREVVVNLVLDMKRLGHPSFAGADEEGVRLRAATLPTDGVPPEVLKVVAQVDADFDDAEDKLQPQKAATPCDGRQEDVAAAGATFAAQRARAVVAEGCAEEDANQAAAAALKKLREELATEAELRSMEKLEVRAGNQLVDQFQPLYFAVAFCFCFPRGTACPDVRNSAARAEEEEEGRRSRRERSETGAPRVNIRAWAAAMQRRVEAQFRRDWTFGFAVWNYLFRTAVNLQKNAYMFSAPNADGGGYHSLKPEEIGRQRRGEAGPRGFDQAALRELAARRPQDLGQRRSPGREHPWDPRGAQDHAPPDPRLPRLLRDLDLLDFLAFGARHCPDAAPGARARRGPRAAAGRHEEVPGPRRAGAGRRVLPAQPRGLGGEPAKLRGQARAASQGPAGLRGGLQDGRAHVLRRRPLALARSRRTLVLLTLRHLLGVRFCPRCPNCATSERPCSDAFRSNALATGGVLGRVDVVFGSGSRWGTGRLPRSSDTTGSSHPEQDGLRRAAKGRRACQAPRPGGPGRARRPLGGGLREVRLAALLLVDDPPRRRLRRRPLPGRPLQVWPDWRRALRRRLILRGFPTEEVKLFALNFCFVYCLPRELRPDQHLQENSDNEVQDEPVFFDEADLEAARATHVRGAGKLGSGDAGENGEEDGEVEDEAAATRLCVMTKQMFDLFRAAWKTGGTASALPGPRRALLGPKTRSLTTTRSPRPPARRGASSGCRCSRASAWPRRIPKRSRLGRA
ncbi:unnamed protein product [Effrenium voratum]|nr:unnamed protein product [Effrenium voratum]